MRKLILVTGVEGLLRKTLESIWEEGQYKGDIIVFQYDYFSPKFIKQLEEHNVIIKKEVKEYPYWSIEKIRASYNILKDGLWKQYDVIMIVDGNDIRVFEDINPLFEMAKDKICCVAELYECSINKNWVGHCNYPVEETEWWSKIRDRPMLNAGLFLGKSSYIIELLEFMVSEIDKYKTWGIDQTVFNAYCYHHHPERVNLIGIEWNYLGWYRQYQVTMDGCIANMNGEQFKIKILHLVNIHINKQKPWDATIVNRRKL